MPVNRTLLIVLAPFLFFSLSTVLLALGTDGDLAEASVTGVVTLEGKPQSDARVLLLQMDHFVEKPLEARTDAEGRFSLEHVPAGTYQVCALWGNSCSMSGMGAGYAVHLAPNAQAKLALELVQGRRVSFELVSEEGGVIANAQVVINFQLFRGTTDADGHVSFFLPPGTWVAECTGSGFASSLSAFAVGEEDDRLIKVVLSRGGTLHGTLTDAKHQALEGTTIKTLLGKEQVTDAEGHFSLENLQLGSYGFFQATKPGFAKYQDDFLVADTDFEQTFVLDALPTESISGTVADDLGRAIAGAEIRYNGKTYHSDAQGRFQLVAGPEVGTVSAKGYGSLQFEIEDAAPLELVLNKGFSKSGVVQDAAGKGLAGAIIYRTTGHASTDAQGHFSLEGLEADEPVSFFVNGLGMKHLNLRDDGEALVVVFEPVKPLLGRVVDRSSGKAISAFSINEISFEHALGKFRWLSALPIVIKAPGHERLELDHLQGEGEQLVELEPLPEGDRRVTGRVLDSQGQGIAGCRVQMVGMYVPEEPRVLTDENGAFVFENVISQPALSFELEKSGYGQTLISDVAEDDWVNLEIQLKRAVQLNVEVNLERYPNATYVNLNCGSDGVRLDAKGKCSLMDVPVDNDCDIRVADADQNQLLVVPMPSNLVEGQAAALRIGFGAVYRLNGRITTGGKNVAQGTALALPESASVPLQAPIDGEGHFQFDALPAGVYNLFYLDGVPLKGLALNASLPNMRVEVKGDLDQTFDFPLAGKVVGHLRTSTQGWRISLNGLELEPEDGAFSFSPVKPGSSLILEARRPNRNMNEPRYFLGKDLLMPLDGSDLNLGDWDIKDGGMLRLVEKQKKNANIVLRLSGASPQPFRVEQYASFFTGEALVKDLPEGLMIVELETHDPTHLARPNRFQVSLTHEKEVELGFELLLTTYLEVRAGQEFESATLEDTEGKVHIFKNVALSNQKIASGEATLDFNGARARGMAAGEWTFKATLKDGTTHIRKIELINGKAIEIDLASN